MRRLDTIEERAARFPGLAVALTVLVSVWPASAMGQAPKAGVVTTLTGSATATRAPAAEPVALKFRDDVFLHDRITTAEQSLARLLLGGKAVVTIRERSALTITEVPGHATIGLQSGKIALAVAREKMRPGEVIDIRTPSAIAAVRGTVVVVKIQDGPARPVTGLVSDVWVVSDPTGHGVLVTPLDPATGAPDGPSVVVRGLQAYSTSTRRVVSITPGQVAAITADLRADPADTGPVNVEAIVAAQMDAAAALVAAASELYALVAPPPMNPSPQPGITEIGSSVHGPISCASGGCTTPAASGPQRESGPHDYSFDKASVGNLGFRGK